MHRTWVWCVAALALLAGAADASAITPVTPAVRVTLLDAKQADVLKRSAVRAHVIARASGRYRVTLRAGREHVGTLEIKLRANRERTVRFSLSPAGRRTMGSCLTRTIGVRAFRGDTQGFITSTYVLDAKRCKGSAGAPQAPQVLSASGGSTVEPLKVPTFTVKLLTTDPVAVRQSGRLDARITARNTASVRISAFGAENGKTVALAPARTYRIRARKAKSQTLRFKLSAQGRRALAVCVDTRITFVVKARGYGSPKLVTRRPTKTVERRVVFGCKSGKLVPITGSSGEPGGRPPNPGTTGSTGGGTTGGGGSGGGSAPPEYVGYKVGAAKRETNPPNRENVCLGGYGFCPKGGGRTMTGVRDDGMFARALAISEGKDGFLIVHTTNIGFFATYKEPNLSGIGSYYARQEIAKQTGLRADHILIQADHSHSGPDTIGIWGGVPKSFMEHLQKQTIAAGVAAWNKREPAVLSAGTANGDGVTSSYKSAPNDKVDSEFRMLWADNAEGDRVATWINYSPHATVLKSDNLKASGDWPEFAADMAEKRFGGGGIGGVATLGREDFGAEGNEATRVAIAKARLARMIGDATVAGLPVPLAGGVKVKTTFFREPLAQPVLLLNFLPEGALSLPSQVPGYGGFDISLDRGLTPPFNNGALVGTYAGAVRIGDLFFGFAPGESFPQIQFYMRDKPKGLDGPRIFFHLGAINDFLGYMVYPINAYPQLVQNGATYLGVSCPERFVTGPTLGSKQFQDLTGIPYDGACTDHWTLQVSPTIGTHVACTIQNAGVALGFKRGNTDDACPATTATDGQAGPKEEGA